MPIYEYRCEDCGHRFEELQSRSDEVPSGCPVCGARQVKRLPSAFAVGHGGSPVPRGSCGAGGCSCCG